MIKRLSISVISLIIATTSLGLVNVDCALAEKRAARKIWTIDEILDERLAEDESIKIKYCSGGAFKPCVCWPNVTKLAQYRPAVKECKKNAAVILSGKYRDIYSVVVRDFENKDRWPPQGINGCSAYERDVIALNKCSAFKVQKKIAVERDDHNDAYVHCLGASGYSKLFSRVRRMTVKLADIPGSNSDPLLRWCLNGPTNPLN